MADKFEDILSKRLSRRSLIKSSLFLGASSLLSFASSKISFAREEDYWYFEDLVPESYDKIAIAEGYKFQPLLSWGDSLNPKYPGLNIKHQTAETQKNQIGYNHDFVSYFGINENEAILGINHEYTNPIDMFSEMDLDAVDYGKIQMEAVGVTIAHIKKQNDNWSLVQDSKYNRRITLTNKMDISGVARGSDRMKTSYDKKGEFVYGTFANCSGGKTPWNTMITAEENINYAFTGDRLDKNHPERKSHDFMKIGTKKKDRHLSKIDKRFDVGIEPNESNRFGYLVEIDPFNPNKVPKKLTSLGRFMHECGECVLSSDGKVVVYMADDANFEHLYKFVSKEPWQKGVNEDNIFNDGTLYVAKFSSDGTLRWMPLVYGNKGLTKKYGFNNQADIVIEARRAARNVGATQMDRPEGISVDKKTGKVYVALTNNIKRIRTNSANPRSANFHGHIIEISTTAKDHSKEIDNWDIFLLAGNDKKLKKHNRVSCPDNVCVGTNDKLWIATDGMHRTLRKNDGLFVADVSGINKGKPRLFFQGPKGAEICSPCFSDDGKTLFVAIQHPGKQNGRGIGDEIQWPDNRSDWPSRPSILAITKMV